MNCAKLHLFDMDHTLIDTDCDLIWKYYGVKAGIAPADAVERADFFMAQYDAGTLDQAAFEEFQFAEFTGRTPDEMAYHAQCCFEQFVRDKIYPSALKLVRELIAADIPVGILTSTNTVLARPVADFFGIAELDGTELALQNGRFTGRTVDGFKVGPGKVGPGREFARKHGFSLADLAYYGDSINDREILSAVGFPIAANPSADLLALAKSNGWPILNF